MAGWLHSGYPREKSPLGQAPKSEGDLAGSLAGAALAIVLLTAISDWPPILVAILTIATYAAPQIIRAAKPRSFQFGLNRDIVLKLAGLYVILALLLGSLLAVSALGYQRFDLGGLLLAVAIPFLVVAAVPYFCALDGETGRDSYFRLGSVFTGDFKLAWTGLKELAPGWSIKGFFLPLMLWELVRSITYFDRAVNSAVDPISYWYAVSVSMIYFTDVCIGTAGYCATFRLFGWHIRSCNPNPLAWVVTLVCYYPFSGIVLGSALDYQDGHLWSDWLATHPLILGIWGAAIVVLKLCWIWALAPFGLRFSNLTNRGIITDGAFRWTKHPSYISKNLFWWMIHIPFLAPGGGWIAATNSLQLAALGVIYFLRAKFEERHLREEPLYRDYSAWISKHGALAKVRGFILPRPTAVPLT